MTLRILLIDDDESNRLTLSVLFEEEGYAVDVAASFAEGSERVRAGGTWDVVLLDQHLGDGLGTELLPRIRAAVPGARIILISGSLRESELSGHERELNGVFPKGGEFPKLLAEVRRDR